MKMVKDEFGVDRNPCHKCGNPAIWWDGEHSYCHHCLIIEHPRSCPDPCTQSGREEIARCLKEVSHD